MEESEKFKEQKRLLHIIEYKELLNEALYEWQLEIMSHGVLDEARKNIKCLSANEKKFFKIMEDVLSKCDGQLSNKDAKTILRRYYYMLNENNLL